MFELNDRLLASNNNLLVDNTFIGEKKRERGENFNFSRTIGLSHPEIDAFCSTRCVSDDSMSYLHISTSSLLLMTGLRTIKLITFDAYNTLFKPTGSISAQYVTTSKLQK